MSFLGEFACVSEHKKDAPLPAVELAKNFFEIALDKLGILWQAANYMGVNYMAVSC